MPDCGYCEASFDDEAAYLDHLREVHAAELGPIDQRRVATESSDGLPTGPLAIGLVVLAAAAVIGYVIFLTGSGESANGAGPQNVGSVHYHGTIEVVVDGMVVDFSQPKYQRPQENPAFHFEGGDGTTWHVHAEGVTLAYAMATLDIDVTGDTVTVDDTTYDDADPDTTVRVEVNGDAVVPTEYVLNEGDAVRIVVEVA